MRTLSPFSRSRETALSKARRLAMPVVLALASLGTTTSATLAQGGPCVDFLTSRHAFVAWDPGGNNLTWVTAVKGNHYIPSSSHFYACSVNGVGDDGPSTWVSIEPGSGSTEYGEAWAILQIGVIRCTFISLVCTSSVPHFFWASGGCGGYNPSPQNIATAPWSTTKVYEIGENGSSYVLKINGVIKATIAKSHASISCWINQDREATWSVERWDRGDSAGSNGSTSQRIQMTTMRYAVAANNVWVSPNFSSCENAYPSGAGRYVCTVPTADSTHVWTLNP